MANNGVVVLEVPKNVVGKVGFGVIELLELVIRRGTERVVPYRAVSYTHLDVYKRQLYYNAFITY